MLDASAHAPGDLAAEGGVAETYVANLISGSLIHPDEAATTAATVVTLLSSEEQRQAMGSAARARVAREFPEQAMIDGFLAATGRT